MVALVAHVESLAVRSMVKTVYLSRATNSAMNSVWSAFKMHLLGFGHLAVCGLQASCAIAVLVLTPLRSSAFAISEANDLPSATEITSGYQQNFAPSLPIAIDFHVSEKQEAGLIEEERAKLWEQEQILAAKQMSVTSKGSDVAESEILASLKSEAESTITGLRTRLEPDVVARRLAKTVQYQMRFWTDRNAYQFRWPRNSEDINVSLQPAGINPEALLKSYGHIQVASWSKSNSPPLRCWLGTQNKPPGPGGRVADGAIDEVFADASFPPVGFMRADWSGASAWNELDMFMTLPPDKYKVIGIEEIDGRPCIVMDGVIGTAGDGRSYVEKVRGWIDPSQGFLPLRLVRAIDNAFGSESLRRRVTEIVEVKKIDDMYYPVQVRRQEFVPDHRWLLARKKQQLNGETPSNESSPPAMPSRTISWTASGVNAHQSIDPSELSLEFPAETLYLNMVDNEWYRTGTPKNVFDRQLAKERSLAMRGGAIPQRASRFSSWPVIANIAIIIGVAFLMVVVRRRRMQGA